MEAMIKMIKTISLLILVSMQTANSQTIIFVDPAFEQAVLTHDSIIDANHDGLIQLSEASGVRELNLMEKKITSIQDVYHFPNIVRFVVTNNLIEDVTLTGLSLLEEFYCARNKLTELNVSNLPSLLELGIGVNELTEITLHNLPNLESFNCMNNQLEALDVTDFKKLKYLSADNNKLKSLDISKNLELIQIVIGNNQLEEIDISKNVNLNINIMYTDDNVKIIRNKNQTSEKAVPPPPMSMPDSSNEPLIDSIVVNCRYEELFNILKEEIIGISAKKKNWNVEIQAEVRSKIEYSRFQDFVYYNAYSSESEQELLKLLSDCKSIKNDPILNDPTVFKSIVLSNYDNYIRAICNKYE